MQISTNKNGNGILKVYLPQKQIIIMELKLRLNKITWLESAIRDSRFGMYNKCKFMVFS